jgi:5-methylcytosine-specific restriction endonuclease McrA
VPCRSRRQMPKGWRQTVDYVIWRDNWVCHLCGKDGADTADHIIPVSRGGSDELENLRAAHKTCNRKRGNHSPPKPLPRRSRFDAAPH